MAYLVTEVALEMMGYKFFDVDGDAAKLTLNPTINETNPEKAEAGTPNFFEVVGFEDELCKPSAETPPPPPPAASDDEPVISAWGALDPSPPPSISGSDWSPRPAPALMPIDSISRRKLTDQISKEYKIVQKQVEQQKADFLEANAAGETSAGADEEQLLQTFMLELRTKLQRELEIIGNLRMEVEEVLADTNMGAYDRYKMLFD